MWFGVWRSVVVAGSFRRNSWLPLDDDEKTKILKNDVLGERTVGVWGMVGYPNTSQTGTTSQAHQPQ